MVIGRSLAGFSCAWALANKGWEVYLADCKTDNGSVPDIYSVELSVFGIGPKCTGTEIEAACTEELMRLQVENIFPFDIEYVASEQRCYILDQPGARNRPIDVVAFAPNGSDANDYSDISEIAASTPKSFSAWSDGEYFAGRTVSVIGDGYRSLDQACLLAKLGCNVEVFGTIVSDLLSSYLYDEAARLGVSWFSLRELRSRIKSSACVFYARELSSSWYALGIECEPTSAIRNKRVFPAGIVKGINYWSHRALWRSGLEAAEDASRAE